MKSWLIGKEPDTGKDRGQEEKGTTEDEIVGWHLRLNGHEFEWLIVNNREAWHASVHGVANSWTWLSNWTTEQQPQNLSHNLNGFSFFVSLKSFCHFNVLYMTLFPHRICQQVQWKSLGFHYVSDTGFMTFDNLTTSWAFVPMECWILFLVDLICHLELNNY